MKTTHPPGSLRDGIRNVKDVCSGGSTILYAEDNPALRCLSTLLLTRKGYAVRPVEDGVQAWEALHSDTFDLLITDNDMPRLSGLELIEKVRLEGLKLPIILASGSLNHLGTAKFESLDLAAKLQKPFAADELLETVEQVLRAASNRDDGGGVSFRFITKDFNRLPPCEP